MKKVNDWNVKFKTNAKNLDFRAKWSDFDYMNRIIAK